MLCIITTLYNHNHYLLLFHNLQYFVLLLIVFITMLVGGVVGYVFRRDVDDSLYRAMWSSIPSYNNDTTVTRAWDEIQRNVRHYARSQQSRLLQMSWINFVRTSVRLSVV